MDQGLDEYPLLCETLKRAGREPVGFARPTSNTHPEG